MAVDPAFQRRGIAPLFFAKAEQLAKERGFKCVRVDTNKCNIAMQKIIPAAGYVYKG
jgi:GNAT superfamily N-acetyltransferase